MNKKRVLAAIMFTDITGFSAMMQLDEAKAARVRDRHREVFKASHERFNGQILQYFGDGTLSIFTSVAAAVECAVEMQTEFQKEPHVPLRIGIHAGDITYDDEGAYGDSMNIASRVENLCLPGSVFITSKVHDDIKNHRWLAAKYMGKFALRNIIEKQDIYAITSRGLLVPDPADLGAYQAPPENNEVLTGEVDAPKGRRKIVAFFLALCLGVFGVHRMYLGKRGTGIAMFVVSMVMLIATIEEGVPLIAVTALIGFVDAVLLLFMPKSEFDRKYNGVKASKTKSKPVIRKPQSKSDPVEAEYQKALRLYKAGKMYKTIEQLDKVLDMYPGHALSHFYLAKVFSQLYDKEDAYFHLSRAVEYGFDDFLWIEKDKDLHFIRSQPDFDLFKRNGYKPLASLPPKPEEDLLENLKKGQATRLEQIEWLGEMMESGKISKQEFEVQKRRILDSDS